VPTYYDSHEGLSVLIGLYGFTIIDKDGIKYHLFFREPEDIARFMRHCKHTSYTHYICEADYIKKCIKKADEMELDLHVLIEIENDKAYIKGDTYPIRGELRKLGCQWDPDRKAWTTNVGNIDKVIVGLESIGVVVDIERRTC